MGNLNPGNEDDRDEDDENNAGENDGGDNVEMAMNQAQLQQLLDAVAARPAGGGSKKLVNLDATTGQDWRTWKDHFLTVVNINGWDDLRKRRELKAAMGGEAARLTGDINIDPPALVQGAVAPPGRLGTIELALAAYEARFIPPAAGRVARLEYHAAKQRPDELVTQWHGRLREMFIRAYPNEAVETSLGLITMFSMNMINEEVGQFVADRDPQTYMEASNFAQQKAATALAFASKHKGGHMNNLGLNALREGTNNGQGNRVCWWCEGPHLQRECASFKKAQDYHLKEKEKDRSRNPRDNRGPRRGRGRGNPGQSGGNRSGNPGQGTAPARNYRGQAQASRGAAYKPRLNQLGGQNEDYWSDADEPAAVHEEKVEADVPISGNGQGR